MTTRDAHAAPDGPGTAGPERPLVLGVDSSTQSCTIVVVDPTDGAVLGRASAPHPPTAPPVSEQSPLAWWSAFTDALAGLTAHLPRVGAISVAGQQHGLVLLDGTGAPLRPAKLWNDTTSAPQADRLVAELGAAGWAARIGSVPVASFTITKLAWVAEHEPELLDRVAMVQLPHDHLTWRLTGNHVTDRGDASGTGWWSPSVGDLDEELLDLALAPAGRSADPGWFPHVLGPTDAAGPMDRYLAAKLGFGLDADVLVAPGTGDNMAGALGIGLGPGDVAISLGTSGTVYAASTTPTADVSGAVAGFADANGAFLPLVCTLNATKVLDRMRDWFGVDHDGLAELAAAATPGAGGLTLVPYLDGERTPNRPDARGMLLGVGNDTGRAEIARAAFEGVTCGLLDGLDALAAAGATVDGSIQLIGGGARSRFHAQTFADLAQRPVTVPTAADAVAVGAAAQAAAVRNGGDPAALAAGWSAEGGVETFTPRLEAGTAAAIRDRYARRLAASDAVDATNDA